MGIDFKALISNLGINAAKMQKDETKIDTKTELNTYVSGWDAIKAKAEADNITAKNDAEITDIGELEAEMKSELAGLMGADFGKTAGVENKGTKEKPFFSEEDISLENMMEILANAPLEEADGIDMKKLEEYNKKPMISSWAEQTAMDEMTEFGFDQELTEIIMEQTPGAVKYISDAIKSGSANRITDNVIQAEKDEAGAKNVLKALYEQALERHKILSEQKLKKVEENFKESHKID